MDQGFQDGCILPELVWQIIPDKFQKERVRLRQWSRGVQIILPLCCVQGGPGVSRPGIDMAVDEALVSVQFTQAQRPARMV